MSSVAGAFPNAYEGASAVIPSCAQANNIDQGNFFQSRDIKVGGRKKSKKHYRSVSKMSRRRRCRTVNKRRKNIKSKKTL